MKGFFITAGLLVALAVPSAAMADVTNNPSTKDSYGYATANATRLVKDGVYPGDHGIGVYRAGSGGESISNLAVNGSTMYPDWVTDQDAFGPISNNGK
jgi:hypothetical protein